MQDENPKIGISTAFDYSIPLKRSLPLIKQAGFDIISIGGQQEHSGYLTSQGKENILNLVNENQLKIDSIHAPFRGEGDISSVNEIVRKEGIKLTQSTIDACFQLGADIIILHLSYDQVTQLERRKKNVLESMRILLPYAFEKKVKIAVENLTEKGSQIVLEAVLDEFDNDHLGLCFDTSHANLDHNPFEILERYKERLIATHISDNQGEADDHLLPFEGKINWESFKKLIRNINYQGIFLIESVTEFSEIKEPELFLKEAKKRIEKILK